VSIRTSALAATVCVALAAAGWAAAPLIVPPATPPAPPARGGTFTAVDPPRPFPALPLTALDGNPADLARLTGGRPALVNLWATWCAPCVRELPSLDRLAAARGIPVVAVSVDIGGPEPVRAFLAKRPAPHLAVALEPTAKLLPQLGETALPVTLLTDAQGRVIARYPGGAEWDRPEMAGLVEKGLAGR
jgi:thiol-disulfide isomerase/thioredoxin